MLPVWICRKPILELPWVLGRQADVSDRHQFSLAFEEVLQAPLFVIICLALVPIRVADRLKEPPRKRQHDDLAVEDAPDRREAGPCQEGRQGNVQRGSPLGCSVLVCSR